MATDSGFSHELDLRSASELQRILSVAGPPFIYPFFLLNILTIASGCIIGVGVSNGLWGFRPVDYLSTGVRFRSHVRQNGTVGDIFVVQFRGHKSQRRSRIKTLIISLSHESSLANTGGLNTVHEELWVSRVGGCSRRGSRFRVLRSFTGKRKDGSTHSRTRFK